VQKVEDMTPKQGDKEPVARGMLMDESATPARHSLVTPQELPPAEGDESEGRFALLDERDHGAANEPAVGRRRAAEKPVTPTETAPPPRAQ
jgi:hypothetical protein